MAGKIRAQGADASLRGVILRNVEAADGHRRVGRFTIVNVMR